MPDRDRTSKTVHWVGTGLSTGSGLRMLADRADFLVLWGRTVGKAAECARTLGLPGRVETQAYDLDRLTQRVLPGDVVVSMLPAGEHLSLLRACVDRRAHFACSSYATEEIAALASRAAQLGLTVLTEAGLDPGIDHLLAQVLIDNAREHLGDVPATLSLFSYCGGLPAIANEFRYRFSWAPRGVLSALLSPARYVESGIERMVEYPWEVVRPRMVDSELFEVYPNRDSVPFIDQYGIPANWQVGNFVRGTLRLSGWQAAWAGVFSALKARGPAVVDELAAELALRYPTTATDLDRVVLTVRLEARSPDGRTWCGGRHLDLVGTTQENAMALCVSMPLAVGVVGILEHTLPPGLSRGAETAAQARRWLRELERHGLSFRSDQTACTRSPEASAGVPLTAALTPNGAKGAS